MAFNLGAGMRDSVQRVETALGLVLFQKLFRVYGGHAPRARGRDGLAVAVVLDIAGNEHAGNGGQAAVLGNQIAVRIHFDFSLEHRGIRIVADGYEHSVEHDFARFSGLRVAQPHTFHETFGGEDFLDYGRRDELDFLVGLGAINHDLGGAEFLAAVDEIDLAGVARKKVGLFHRGIAAAHHGDRLASEEIAVAGGAGGNAVADQFLFAREAQQTRGCTGSNNQSLRFIGIFSGDDPERAPGEVHFRDGSGFEFRAEFLRLLAHVFNELRRQNPFREAGEIFDMSGEGKLTAGFVSVQDERLQVRTRGVDRGGEASAATSDDDDIVHSLSLQAIRFTTAAAGYYGARYCSIPSRAFRRGGTANLERLSTWTALTRTNRRRYSAEKVCVVQGESHDGSALPDWEI